MVWYLASVYFWTKSEAQWCFQKKEHVIDLLFPNQCFNFSLEEIPISNFFKSEPRQYAYQFEQYAYFF